MNHQSIKFLPEPISITEHCWPEGTLPFVCTGTLTYNHEPYIRECIEGILSQKTKFPVHIVIFEDCSTDKTALIIKEYEKRHPNLFTVFYMFQNTYGKSIRDEALKPYREARSKGNYIAICEGDDYWTDPLKLQKQVDLMEEYPDCSMCVAQTEWIKNNEVINVTGEGDKLFYYFDDIINGKYFHTSTYLVRKNMLDKYELANPKLRDGDTTMRYFFSDLGPFVLLNEKVSVYRLTGCGVWTGIGTESQAKWHIRIYKSFYYHFKPKYRIHFLKKLIDTYLNLLIVNIKYLNIKKIILNFSQLMFWGFKNPLYLVKSIYNIIKLYLFKMLNNFRNK